MLLWLGLKREKGFKQSASLGDNLLSRQNNLQEAKGMKPHCESSENPFQASEAQFLLMCSNLIQEKVRTLSEIEDYLQEQGSKLMCQLIQDRLNLVSQREQSAQLAMGPDKVKRADKRRQSRQLETVYGSVVLSRMSYGTRGFASVHPLDGELNLPESKYSYGLQKIVCAEVGLRSFDETLSQMEELVAGHVPKRQAEEIALRSSHDFDAFYAQKKALGEIKTDILVLSFDGKGIVMRPIDLKMAQSKKCKSRKCRPFAKQTRDRKRMATVCALFSIERYARTPVMIAKSLYPSEVKAKRPKPIGKQVWASIKKPMKTVIEEGFAQALERDPEKKMQWVVLVDGNKAQINMVKNQARKMGVKVRIIVDFIHVLEYVWKAAIAFYGEGNLETQNWVSEKMLRILQGESSMMASAMRRAATRRGVSGTQREAVDKCANYLLNQKAYLRYDLYLSKGYPIATGVIEGACRYLVKDRMERTGARWRLEGAEAVLKMRALKTNGDFEDYWQFHQQQQWQRNYAGVRKVFSGVKIKEKLGSKQQYDRDDAA